MGVKLISVEEAQSGMVVAAEVLDSAGRVIIPKGAKLTPMAIRRLPKWGVKGISVVESAEDTSQTTTISRADLEGQSDGEKADQEFVTRVAKGVLERFSGIPGQPFMDEYKRIVTRQLVEKGKGVVPGL